MPFQNRTHPKLARYMWGIVKCATGLVNLHVRFQVISVRIENFDGKARILLVWVLLM
jgi:hypothetical protein